jgi:hypothetical protein
MIFSGSHAPAWEPIRVAKASRDAGASGLHSHAGAWERESLGYVIIIT